MPYNNVPDRLIPTMDRCVRKVMSQNHSKESAIAICHASIVQGKADATKTLVDAGFVFTEDEKNMIIENIGAKFTLVAAKAVGDWELDVLAIPFGMDDEGQWMDERTDIMESVFNNPAVIYQHSLKTGGEDLLRKGQNPFENKPETIGTAVPGSLNKQFDGWHVRVILDKTKELAKKVMDAAKRGLVAVSSGTVEHLARLTVKGQNIPYTKEERGYISVWPFAEISLWDLSEGNFRPASRIAYATPAMKSIYETAGIELPNLLKTEVLKETPSRDSKELEKIRQLRQKTDEIKKFVELF